MTDFKFAILAAVVAIAAITAGMTVSYMNRTPVERCADSCAGLGVRGQWASTPDGHQSCTCVKSP